MSECFNWNVWCSKVSRKTVPCPRSLYSETAVAVMHCCQCIIMHSCRCIQGDELIGEELTDVEMTTVQRIANELLTTERTYVKKLYLIDQVTIFILHCSVWHKLSIIFCFFCRKCKRQKLKFFRTCYWAFGPELIPVYRQSARRWLFKSSQC